MANVPSYMHIRKYIIDMVFEHKDSEVRISSERELSARFGVSRTTVRNALRDLVNDGYLYNKPGRGMFILELLFLVFLRFCVIIRYSSYSYLTIGASAQSSSSR